MTKTLLITGASTGIGEATAHAAASAGWNVALLARSEDKLNALASDIGESAIAVPCDVTDRDALKAAVSSTRSPLVCARRAAQQAAPHSVAWHDDNSKPVPEQL